MTPIQKAYALGQHLAKVAFEKEAAMRINLAPKKLSDSPKTLASFIKKTLGKQRGLPRETIKSTKDFNVTNIGLYDDVAKMGEAALGDPNFWGGGTPSPEEAAPPAPQSAEEAIQLLPAGTFQGAQIKIQPDGIRNTTVKVTPDVVGQPDGLAAVFQAEPTAKVEISQPEQQAAGGEQPPMPPEGTPMDPAMAGAPPEEMPPPA